MDARIIIYSVLVLAGLAVFFAVVIYFVGQKFKVFENPLIDDVQAELPGANCGGCGFPGCRGFAEAVVKAGDLNNMFCPVGGNELSKKIASLLGVQAIDRDPQWACIRCNGSIQNSPKKVHYNGLESCQFVNNFFMGENLCKYGCLGMGDCERVCLFNAIGINKETGLPVVDLENCTACGACVKACPRGIIELRTKPESKKQVFVQCVNKEKGGIARKNCQVACIACKKCFKTCKYQAITISDNLAYIDFSKCTLCGDCVAGCPTKAIYCNFELQGVVLEKEVANG